MPSSVCQRRVNKYKKQANKENIGRKPDTLCKGTCNQSRCEKGKLQLKHRKQNERNCRRAIPRSMISNPVKHKKRHRISNDSADRISENQTETESKPHNGYDRHTYKTLEHARTDIPFLYD